MSVKTMLMSRRDSRIAIASSASPASTTSKPRLCDHGGCIHSQQQLVLDE
jgi:hypothetical protein